MRFSGGATARSTRARMLANVSAWDSVKPASFRRSRCVFLVDVAMDSISALRALRASAAAFALSAASGEMLVLEAEARRMTTLLYTHPSSALHDPGPGHPERPARIQA